MSVQREVSICTVRHDARGGAGTQCDPEEGGNEEAWGARGDGGAEDRWLRLAAVWDPESASRKIYMNGRMIQEDNAQGKGHNLAGAEEGAAGAEEPGAAGAEFAAALAKLRELLVLVLDEAEIRDWLVELGAHRFELETES